MATKKKERLILEKKLLNDGDYFDFKIKDIDVASIRSTVMNMNNAVRVKQLCKTDKRPYSVIQVDSKTIRVIRNFK